MDAYEDEDDLYRDGDMDPGLAWLWRVYDHLSVRVVGAAQRGPRVIPARGLWPHADVAESIGSQQHINSGQKHTLMVIGTPQVRPSRAHLPPAWHVVHPVPRCAAQQPQGGPVQVPEGSWA